jgi:hypothetical protein
MSPFPEHGGYSRMMAPLVEKMRSDDAYVERALKAIEGKTGQEAMDLLEEYVNTGSLEKVADEQLAILRRRWIRIYNETYRPRVV